MHANKIILSFLVSSHIAGMPRSSGEQLLETLMPTNAVTWFITGASSGYGLALARHAIARGYNVVATARSAARLAALTALAPDRVLAQKLDVTAPDDAATAVKAAIARFGRIDVLINNAGYGMIGAVEETPEAEFRAQMETNFFGAVSVTKAVLPHLRAQKSGAIVNISSMGGQLSFAGASAYSASKFALEGLSEALALEVAPFGIKVIIVERGALRTNFSADGALKLMPAMEAYQDIVGTMRALVRDMHGSQDGDPAKAAHVLDLALQADNPPLRLQIGADSIAAVRAHAEQLLRDLATWEQVGSDVRVDPNAPAAIWPDSLDAAKRDAAT
jgi:NAD(P)-dependent dehydrogenase (short-subunit alcohol dehydrogenase family)